MTNKFNPATRGPHSTPKRRRHLRELARQQRGKPLHVNAGATAAASYKLRSLGLTKEQAPALYRHYCDFYMKKFVARRQHRAA